MPYKNPLTKEQKEKQRDRTKEWYELNRDRLLENSKKRYEEKKDEILAYQKELYRKNKEEKLKKQRERRITNRSKVLEIEKSYRDKNKEKCKQSKQRYINKNKEKILSASRDWRERNRSRVKTYWQNRKKRISGLSISIDLVDRLLVLQRGKCACCGETLGTNYEIDHIIPLALGGINEDTNIQLLRKTCNRKKGAKHPIEFMQQRGFLL
jgi:5-methylcytosine-specific restriction endonuclease McrA